MIKSTPTTKMRKRLTCREAENHKYDDNKNEKMHHLRHNNILVKSNLWVIINEKSQDLNPPPIKLW